VSGDTRFIVDDEAYEKKAADATDSLAKEGKLVPYTTLAKTAPASHPETAVAPLAGKALARRNWPRRSAKAPWPSGCATTSRSRKSGAS